MLIRNTSRRARWRVAATLLAAGSLVSFGATAQETEEAEEGSEDAVEFETFEVTGSRIKRSDYETASPVLVIDRESIERTGLNSIGELIKDLPQAGASLGRAFNNGGDGSVEIDLRNLGSTRVLVLVDGRRWIPGTRVLGGGGVDLSTIPISIVERIEVLQDGASAVYGSDAVAGVVNIITRKDFQGLESRFQAGAFDDGEGFEKTASFAAGQVSGNTSVFFDVSYRQVDPLGAGDRALSAVPTFGVPNTSRGSLFTPEGTFLFVPDDAASFNAGQETPPCFTLVGAAGLAFPTPSSTGVPGAPALPTVEDPGLGDADPGTVGPLTTGVPLCVFRFEEGSGGTSSLPNYSDFNFNTDAFNFAPLNFLITPQERSSIFGQVSHRINDYVNFDSQVLYNVRESQQSLAPNPLITGDLFPFPFNQAFLHSMQEFNPFGQDVGRAGPDGLVGLGTVGRRMLEAGRRDFFQKNETFRVGVDFDGTFDAFDNFFAWEVGYTFAESQTQVTEEGLQNLQRVAFALGDPANCTADPEDVDGPCVPLNLTGGLGTITQDMLDYINYTALDSDRQAQQITYMGISTEIGQTADFLPGAVGVAFGLERRVDNLDSQPDPLKINGTSSTNLETVTRGETQVTEAFVEVGVPLLRDLPFVQDLNLTLAVRASEYEIPNAVRDVNALVPNPVLDPAADEFDPAAAADPDTPAQVLAFVGTENFTQEFRNTSGKIGLEYRPVEGLLLRTGYSDSFRAPSVSELFLGELQSFPSVTDPCSNRNDAARDDEQNIENVRANCSADGVPENYSQASTQITTVFGGNSQLDPETADSYNIGFVINPGAVFNMPALDGVDLVVDVFRYELEDFITVPGADFVLGLCYQAAPSQRSLCEFVNRTAGGQIANLRTVFSNIAQLNTDGIDIDLTWDIPFFKEYGNFKMVTTAAYTHSYEQVFPSPGGESTLDFVGFSFGVGTIPRWKVNNSLQWAMGPWTASWDIRFIDRTFSICDDGAQGLTALNPDSQTGGPPVGSLEDFGLCDVNDAQVLGGVVDLVELERTIYNDVQVGYQLPWIGGAQLTFGVRNILDQDPPVNPTALANSYNVATYDPPGSRSPYLRFKKDF